MLGINVTNVRVFEYKNSSKLVGFANVEFSVNNTTESQLIIKGFKVWNNDDGKIGIGFPSNKKVVDGKDEYFPVIAIKKEEEGDGPGSQLYELIRSEVEKAWNSREENQGSPKPQASRPPQQEEQAKPKDSSPFDDGIPF